MRPRPLFRIEPKLPPHLVKTYEINSPRSTHTRRASCIDVDCERYKKGWISPCNTNTKLGAQQANYIRLHSGRKFTYTEINGLVKFHFPPGQQCFAEHRVSLERPELFVVRGGDWRGNPRGEEVQRKTDEWVDDFANHQDKLATEHRKG